MKDNVGRFIGFLSPRYTQVPDELFDELLPDLSGAELKVLMYVIRKTFGWKKPSDRISISQMERGIVRSDGRVLDRGTGLGRNTIIRSVKGLVAKNILIKHARTSPEKGYMATEYALNVIEPESRQRPEPGQTTGYKIVPGGNGASAELESGGGGAGAKTVPGPSDANGTSLVAKPGKSLAPKGDLQQTEEQETRRQQHTDVVAPEPNLIEELCRRGISRPSAVFLARAYRDRIPQKLAAFDHLTAQGSSLIAQNPAGYLRRSVEEDWLPPPEIAKTKQEVERRQADEAGRDRRKRLEDAYKGYIDERVNAWRAELGEDERGEFEKRAGESARTKLKNLPSKLMERIWPGVLEHEIGELAREELRLPAFDEWVRSTAGKSS